MNNKIYFESKVFMYVVVFVIIVLVFLFSISSGLPFGSNLISLNAIPFVMLIGVFLYRPATFTVFDDHLEFKKGSQNVSVPWSEVKGIHADPVFATNIFSYYIAKRFPMGGVFLETSQGYTKYFAPQLIRGWSELKTTINDRARSQLTTGDVSIFKQTQKLFDIIFIVSACFVAPVIVILFYGLFTGTLTDSIQMIKELGLALIGK